MQIYGYCRISTPQQNIERQVRNILATYPTAHIIREVYTGTTYQGRKELDKLLHIVQLGDTIVFDSVSRMSRNADEGCQLYENLYTQNVTLCFLKEPHINTETYRQTIQRQISPQLKTGNAATDSFVSSVIAALNQYTVDLAKEQIRLAFAQAQKEVDDLHQRTREGMLTAKLNGKVGTVGENGKPIKVDLDRQLLKPLAGTGKMFCYDSPEYVKDMGTPERYYSVCEDYKTGRVSGKNLKNKQKAVFLDRDGTINKYVGFLRNIDEFELIDGVADAVKMINASGYLAIVVTNQPVIARGEVSFEELEEIHNKMETLLGKEGAYLDAIYFCPHHPHKGYEGERPELKFDCDCRKPKPGMLLNAAQDFNIDLSQSWMIGDGENDIKAGQNAGCQTALIGSESYGQTVAVSSLKDFVEQYLK